MRDDLKFIAACWLLFWTPLLAFWGTVAGVVWWMWS